MFKDIDNVAFLSNGEIAQLLAYRLKKERMAQNFRQKDIALKTGIPLPTYAYFERTGKIPVEKLVGIVRALGKILVLSDFLDFDKERLETDALAWSKQRESKTSRQRIIKR
jgi:transcriptional regulator with XRE-family HTH domain